MSQSRNVVASQLEVLEVYLRGRDIPTLRSYESAEVQKMYDAYSIWIRVAWDTSASAFGSGDIYGVIRRWIDCIMSIPFETVLQSCKDLASSLTDTVFESYDSFKRCHRAAMPFVGELCSPASRHGIVGVNRQNSYSYMRFRTFLVFLTRLNLRHKDLEVQAKERFVTNLSFSPARTTGLEPIITDWFRSADCCLDHWCHHGPGRVAELTRAECTITSKYSVFKSDQLLDYCHPPFDCSKGLDRTSRMICVAKSFDKYRTICSEPAILQWCQQGVSHYLCEAIKKASLRRHVDLNCQDSNRLLSQQGSIDGSFATIDLSNASDSIRWDLVRDSFRHTPFLRYFYACRSRQVVVDGVRHDLSVFATMGSALTFPVECIIFSAIVEQVFDEMDIPGRNRIYRVYGDDIVCPEFLYQKLVNRLEEYGFSVNNSKSFSSSANLFRESCGGEYIQGDDVTPIRISRRFEGLSDLLHQSARYECITELANRCYYSYPETRCFLISQMKKQHIVPRFTANPNLGGTFLFSETATNWLATRRWQSGRMITDNSYQRYERRVHVPTPPRCGRDPRYGDDLRLFEWLRSSQCAPDLPEWERLERIYDSPSPAQVPLNLRWVLDECQED